MTNPLGLPALIALYQNHANTQRDVVMSGRGETFDYEKGLAAGWTRAATEPLRLVKEHQKGTGDEDEAQDL